MGILEFSLIVANFGLLKGVFGQKIFLVRLLNLYEKVYTLFKKYSSSPSVQVKLQKASKKYFIRLQVELVFITIQWLILSLISAMSFLSQ